MLGVVLGTIGVKSRSLYLHATGEFPAAEQVADMRYDAGALDRALKATYYDGGSSYRPASGTPGLHVLFLGNSYTYVNDVPRLVSYIAASDKENHVPIQPGVFALGNITLEALWNNQDAQAAFNSRRWDYVVMQEHSMQTTQPEWVNAMTGAMTQWNGAIRARGGKPIVYETWARAPGSAWYSAPTLNFGSPERMQATIDKVTNDIAAQIQAPVAAAGDYWAKCSKDPQAPQLYNADGTHASIAGSYLNALLLYRQISGRNTDGVTFAPPGLTPAEAAFIRKCAST